jgi:hypothetical protein
MSKYEPLKWHLEESNETIMVLHFVDLDSIVGSLPMPAWSYRGWWVNDITHTQAKAWLNAGWEVESIDIENSQVTFSKKINGSEHEKSHEREKTHKQQQVYTTPQEFFDYFNCPYPCDEDKLKNAYREKVKQNHPDKVDGMSNEFKELADKKMKEINDMYEKALSYYPKG